MSTASITIPAETLASIPCRARRSSRPTRTRNAAVPLLSASTSQITLLNPIVTLVFTAWDSTAAQAVYLRCRARPHQPTSRGRRRARAHPWKQLVLPRPRLPRHQPRRSQLRRRRSIPSPPIPRHPFLLLQGPRRLRSPLLLCQPAPHPYLKPKAHKDPPHHRRRPR